MESVKNVKAYFITSDEDEEADDHMKQAFEMCVSNKIDVSWIKQSVCLEKKFASNNIVVFEKFEGPAFEGLSKNDMGLRLVGPWCMIVCLLEGIPIPKTRHPIFNVAMREIIVSATGLSSKEKMLIKNRVEHMGGLYSIDLSENVTHLVTNGVRSQKYVKAHEMKMRVMTVDWVDKVWERSQGNNVHAISPEFEKYGCPPFYNLQVCSTGLSGKDRDRIMEIIKKGGGVYDGKLRTDSTQVLICNDQDTVPSKKYEVAKAANIPCVTTTWVVESKRQGYALPYEPYRFKPKGACSTPTKENQSFNPNFSVMSSISAIVPKKRLCDTSVDCTVQTTFMQQSIRLEGNNDKSYSQVVDDIDLQKAKKAGPFLDGCGIYLTGFTIDQKDKIGRVLNRSGATRYDDLSSRITHVIVGDIKSLNSNTFKNWGIMPHFVTILWLSECIEQRRMVSEEPFGIKEKSTSVPEAASPLSKKGLNLLHSSQSPAGVENVRKMLLMNHVVDAEKSLLNCYLGSRDDDLNDVDLDNLGRVKRNLGSYEEEAPAREENSRTVTEVKNEETEEQFEETAETSIFEGKRFVIADFDDEDRETLNTKLTKFGGRVMSSSFKGIPDYVVVPYIGSTSQRTAAEVVTDIWVAHCEDQQEFLQPLYYHQPVSVMMDVTPFDGLVFATSGFNYFENLVLVNIIRQLGGYFQDQLSRINCPEKDVKACNYLVCCNFAGKKYEAAKRWKLPVVTSKWLLECGLKGVLIPHESEGDKENADGNVEERKRHSTASTEKQTKKPRMTIEESETATPKQTKVTNVETPKQTNLQNQFETPKMVTPINKFINNVKADGSPDSQITPVNKIMQKWRERSSALLHTPYVTPPPKPSDHMDGTDTPYGAFLYGPNPSPATRTRWKKYVMNAPDNECVNKEYTNIRERTPPLSEMIDECWKALRAREETRTQEESQPGCSKDDEVNSVASSQAYSLPQTDSENAAACQLDHLTDMLNKRRNVGSARKDVTHGDTPILSRVLTAAATVRESQPETVGWGDPLDTLDDNVLLEAPTHDPAFQTRIFMLSGFPVLEKEKYEDIINELKGELFGHSASDLSVTHLVCPKLSRNEKVLSSMASGKWILHASYLDQCKYVNKFVDEEAYEYGNPRSASNVPENPGTEEWALAAHWWRNAVEQRGFRAFEGMRAIVVALKKDAFVSVITSGGGVVIDAEPPYKDVDATHCFIDTKKYTNLNSFVPLALQRVYCLDIIYLAEFLMKRGSLEPLDSIIDGLKQYYL